MGKKVTMSTMVALAIGLGLVAGCMINRLDLSSKDVVLQTETGEGSGRYIFLFLRGEHLDRIVCQDLAGEVRWQVPLPYRMDIALRSVPENGELEGFAIQYSVEAAFSWVDLKTREIQTFRITGNRPPLKIEKFGDKIVATSLIEGGLGLVLELFGLEGEYKKVVLAPPKESPQKPKMIKGGGI